MKTGFTLIELLVVVLIIGILSAVALPQYEKAVDKSRYMQLMVATDALKDAQELYWLANGEYADSFDKLDIEMPAGGKVRPEDGLLMYDGVMHMGMSGDVVYAGSAKMANSYLLYLDHSPGVGLRECRAFGSTQGGNARQDKLCKSLGGVLSYHDSGMNTYRL